ncbi:protein of unknown function [Paraburkholderia dioscoreae]|uniref:Uncharacterized protein n=1 Tax=Paraburkholderia dioscoreae TaxID=2604047 RepID=A0A5Q4YVV4_9BURK|nr:protein of unknown function [Paraburkholderia dioscoreae]
MASGLASAMAAPAVSEAHANAVQSAARRMEGKQARRERRAALARGTESRNGRAFTRGPLKWANFIEILIGVVSTDLNRCGTSPRVRDFAASVRDTNCSRWRDRTHAK